MTDYIGNALKEINPCGIEGKVETHCKYVAECSGLAQENDKAICLYKMAYMVAGYLQQSDAETERNELVGFIESAVGQPLVDPGVEEWKPQALVADQTREITDKIITLGQEYLSQASARGSLKNPVNINCSAEDIVADL